MPRLRDRFSAAAAAWNVGRPPSAAPTTRWRSAGPDSRRRLLPPRRAIPQRKEGKFHAVFQSITSLTAIAALLFTGLTVSATWRQLQLSEQEQFADRFALAISQLGRGGEQNLSIRLGGVYSLERLMHDHPAEAPVVAEVLSVFVRTYTPPRKGITTILGVGLSALLGKAGERFANLLTGPAGLTSTTLRALGHSAWKEVAWKLGNVPIRWVPNKAQTWLNRAVELGTHVVSQVLSRLSTKPVANALGLSG